MTVLEPLTTANSLGGSNNLGGAATAQISNNLKTEDTIDSVTSTMIKTSSMAYPSTTAFVPLKELNTSDLVVIGWVLWLVILVTLLGNFISLYATFNGRNFKVRLKVTIIF